MPQMSPLWWETLFISFTLILMLMNVILFYNKMNKSESEYKKYNKKQINWKW
uniref:ATP synthase complex subunit 8 n=1 Tax=Cryptorhamphus sp. TaxID=2931285 RepID=A0A8T9ZWZ3_9HEMI|nr:ATPase subunit 8 [Cryptorhamphus sp.]